MYTLTTATRKLLRLTKRIRGVAGGTSAGKTISILQILIDQAQAEVDDLGVTSVTSESVPHLKRGAMRDFKNIMQAHRYWDEARWNKTDFIYTFETGNQIEFFSLDMPHKVRGPRRKRLFINEANNIPKETFEQLEVRTEREIWLDWNPTREFWFYTDVLGDRPDVEFIILTYLDNEALAPTIVQSIESRKGNRNWWVVYGLGQLGETEAQIFTSWRIIDEIPHEARLERRGLDFGYSNDPTALIDVYRYNGGLILDEQLYRKGLSNKQIADFISNLPHPETLVVADSAEPKSIDELLSYGVTVLPATKGQGSVNRGIAYLQDQRVSLTKRSVNTIKEYRNYLWKTDSDGRILNVAEDIFNHCLHGDTVVDTSQGQLAIRELVGTTGYLYSEQGKLRRYFDVRMTGTEEIYVVELTDGRIIKCSSEHPFRLADGTWCPAHLLIPMDLIQLVTHGSRNHLANKAAFQWQKLLVWFRSLLPPNREYASIRAIASGRVGLSSWLYSGGVSYSSQGYQLAQQRHQQPRAEASARAPERPYDTGASGEAAGVGERDTPTRLRLAQDRRGQGRSFQDWQRLMARERADKESLLPLWQRIRYAISDTFKVLPSELQDECPTAEIGRVSRTHVKEPVYNLEVQGTHCFSIAGGVIVSNCMDATRYAVDTLSPQRVDEEAIPTYEPIDLSV